MSQVLGIAGLLVAFAVAIAIARWRPVIGPAVLTAVVLRIGAALYHFYIHKLPDGKADAAKFESIAWGLVADPAAIVAKYNITFSMAYSYMAAGIYHFTGRSPLLLQSVSVLIGTLLVVMTWRLAGAVWDAASARVAAWVAAVFPTIIMYSALTMREVYFDAALLLGTILAVQWASTLQLRFGVLAMAAFAIGALFHVGIIGAAVGVLVALALLAFEPQGKRFRRPVIALVVAATVTVIVAVLTNVDVPKLGSLRYFFDLEHFASMLAQRSHGDAVYPDWLSPHAPIDLLWQVPARLLYFLFSPFPWDIRLPVHVIGYLDGAIYLALVALILANLGKIRRNPAARMVLLMFLVLLVSFALGTANFGTAIRHRAKLVLLLVVLASPYLADALRYGLSRIGWGVRHRRSAD